MVDLFKSLILLCYAWIWMTSQIVALKGGFCCIYPECISNVTHKDCSFDFIVPSYTLKIHFPQFNILCSLFSKLS